MKEDAGGLPSETNKSETAGIQPQKTARELLESKEGYEFLLDHSQELILVLNKSGKIIFANKSALTTFGYSKEEITGKSITHFLTRDSVKRALFALAQEFLGRPQPELEVRAQTKSGEIRYLCVAEGSAPIHANGKLLGVMISAIDITEQKKAKRLLEASEKRFRDLWENAPVAYHTADKEGMITGVNQTEANLLGYKREELVGKSVFELILPGQREEARNRFQRRIQGQDVPRSENQAFLRKDGSKIYVAIDDTLEHDGDGGIVGVRSTLVDITKLRESEEALKRSEEHFKDLVEKSGLAILIDDKEGNLSYFNERYARIFGYSAEEMKTQTIWSTVHPDDAQKLREYHRGRLEGKNVPSRYELKAQKKDGTTIYLELDVAVLKEGERLIGTRTYMWDITERKQAELLQNAVYRISQAADKSASLNDLFRSVHEIIATVMPAKNFYISLYDEKNDLITFPYFIDEFDAPPQPVKPRKGLTEYVLRTGRSLLCDEATDRELRGRGEVELIGAPSPIWLGVPLTVDKKPIGVMVVQHYSDPNAYSQRELRMLEYVSSQVAKSIERKRAEDALELSEKKYRNLVENALVGIYQTNVQGQLLYANEALAEMLEFESTDEMMQRFVPDIYKNRADREILIANLREKGKQAALEIELLTKTGKTRTVLLSATLNGDILTGMIKDITDRKQMEERLGYTVAMLRKNLGATIQAIGRLVETRDPYTAGHQRRVADLARAIATEMGLPQEQVDEIRIAGLIHDIGKVAVPAEILGKPGRLTELEFNMIKIHPQYGYEILKPLEFPGPVAEAILQHHERIDGSGYPAGLKGDQILIEARILAVADVFEAMISHRPYRPARSLDQALEEMRKNSGLLYEPMVVKSFLRLLVEKGFRFREEQALTTSPRWQAAY